ncbi:MAG TPA: class I SAM-dependent methyltransferase [Terriglobales bacterium]|nr:class I SAM-dependent methyltransferase [Terriglobales bacterium]
METIQACNVCGCDIFEPADTEWNLCRCLSCGFVFDNPRPTLAEVSDFYSKPTKYDSWVDDERARDDLWERRLKKLLAYCADGNLLDIGTGIGQFLHRARPFFTEVYGTEISASGVRIAKEKYGLNIYHGSIEQLDLPPGFFNNITLFHVLEHVPDPARLLTICWSLLQPNGVLLIAVPNDLLAWTSFLKKTGKWIQLPQFQKFSPKFGLPKVGTSREVHLSHFTPQVLRKLVEGQGFSILEESLDPYFVANGLMKTFHASYLALHQALFSLFNINRYDTIWLIARRDSARTLSDVQSAA